MSQIWCRNHASLTKNSFHNCANKVYETAMIQDKKNLSMTMDSWRGGDALLFNTFVKVSKFAETPEEYSRYWIRWALECSGRAIWIWRAHDVLLTCRKRIDVQYDYRHYCSHIREKYGLYGRLEGFGIQAISRAYKAYVKYCPCPVSQMGESWCTLRKQTIGFWFLTLSIPQYKIISGNRGKDKIKHKLKVFWSASFQSLWRFHLFF